MRITEEQQKILDGKEGKILQKAMSDLVKCGTAMGAEEFIPIASAHTTLSAMEAVAYAFLPRGVPITKDSIDKFSKEIANVRVKVKTTTNPGWMDLRKWRQMGAGEDVYNSVMRAVEVARRCGIMATHSCIPQLTDNIPLFGQHVSFCESSAFPYVNSFIGARTNREAYGVSLYSALLGITPNFGLHLDENRRGTHLVEVQCEMENFSDWGALGFWSGNKVGVGIAVFKNLRRPTVEEAEQLCAGVNSSGAGGVGMFHIPGVTPEAPTIEAAFGGNKPKETYIFDESAKRETYRYLNYKPEGKVDLVFIGCPHATLYQITQLAQMLEGKHVAKDTKLWIMTSSSFRAPAEQLGYAQIIEDSGAELLADGCLSLYYIGTNCKRPNMNRVATDSAKMAFIPRRSFNSNIFFGDTERCIDIAIKGGL